MRHKQEAPGMLFTDNGLESQKARRLLQKKGISFEEFDFGVGFDDKELKAPVLFLSGSRSGFDAIARFSDYYAR